MAGRSSRELLAAALLVAALPIQPAQAQDAVQPSPALALLPGGILPDSPLAQVVKLVQAGVDASIIQSFITNSSSTFNLDANKIIALKDVGAPDELTTLMMQHDRVLQTQIAAATPPPPAVPAPPPLAEVAPLAAAPVDVVPAVTVNYFYDLLAPYGNWVAIDGYGRCWQPGVAAYQPDWQPYADHGHWVYTDSGWYWVSDYSWGWVPFHYGRWLHDTQLGWCWCPDTLWGPSWVTWRYSDDYCGWAPLPPGSEYVDGAGFVYDGSIVAPDYDFGLVPDSFIFVTVLDFCDPHPARHRIDRGRVATIFHQTTPLNHFDRDDRLGFVNHGIDPARITRATHVPIHPLAIHEIAGGAGLFGRGETMQGASVVVNRPEFRDNQGNPAMAWNHDAPAAGNPQAPVGGLAPEQAPGHAPINYQWPAGEPARAAPEADHRLDGKGDYQRPTARVYENNDPAPGHPELSRGLLPPPETRPEPPHGLLPPPEMRPEPARLEPPPPREEPKPAAEPPHNTPAPAEAKSDKDSGKKSGGH